MFICKSHWPKLKQEFIPIVFVSTLQAWGNFKFPSFMILGATWSTIVAVILSVVYTLFYIVAFLSANKYARLFNLEYLDEAPAQCGPIFKNIAKVWFIAIFHTTMFLIWYKDFYGMPTLYYALCYAHCCIAFILFYRAANRVP